MTNHYPTALRRATLSDGSLVDVRIAEGRIIDVSPATGHGGRDELDLDGALLLTAGAEPHTHLDKALVYDRLRPDYGDLLSGIRQWQAHARHLTEEDFADRARALARMFLANGVTAVRTHAEIFPSGDPLRCVRALAGVRAELSGVMDLQIVVLPKNDIDDATIEAALDAGADLVGGSPHTAADPEGELDRLVAIARRRRVGIDIHADERLDPTSLTMRRLARALRREPLAPGTTAMAGHCVSLGLLDPAALHDVAEDLRRAGVSVAAAPLTNLYLQAKDIVAGPVPRAIAPVRALRDAGVLVCGAGDNVRDPLNPLGAADHLVTAGLLVAASHVTIEDAHDCVTAHARAAMGLESAGVEAGRVADLLAIRAPSLAAAVAGGAYDRVVLHRGRVVAQRKVTERTVLDR
ncbi:MULTISPECIES: amidohydrolase family protein [Microbacterium]|jgi:cytosine deaminase|uniref:amidohydrolase family protein n=1 Tax=Microbacterium TaxID=33882 RepID=UPI001D17970F|nr:amidohydrolase family protein [Microbacterium testaceum]MCC4249106.1 amidohydrolase family protein [Microbacterium testaceum]